MAAATARKPALTNDEAAAYLGLKPQTLNNWRSTGRPDQPRYTKVPTLRGAVRYPIEWLDEWRAAHSS